jgi:hypothetical protein
MTETASGDLRARQAALLSVHHHTSRIVIPTFLMPPVLRVMPLKTSLRLLRKPASEGDISLAANETRLAPRTPSGGGSNAAARALARGLDRFGENRGQYLKGACSDARFVIPATEPHVHSLQGQDDPFDPDGVLQEIFPRRPRLPAEEDQPRRCSCCTAAAAAFEAETNQTFPIVHHNHAAWVDLDSAVTTVVVRLKVKDTDERKWFKIFREYADPVNWKDTAGEFFAGSEPIERQFYPDDGGWKGTFREIATWTQNALTMSEFRNVLDIDFRTIEFKGNPAAILRYALIETQESQVGGETERGGLDVDDGYMIAYFDGGPKTVLVEVMKKLRFTDRKGPTLPGGMNMGQLLNFVAPSFVGQWLDNMIYESALYDLKRIGSDLGAGDRKDTGLRPPPATTEADFPKEALSNLRQEAYPWPTPKTK